jgi:threonine dehydrogenase-like Zn-dependent dehydrogenase
MARKAMGQSPAGLFGFSHMMGGYSGGQAEYLRVPMADIGPIKIPENVTDEQALFLSDIFPTGYMATPSRSGAVGRWDNLQSGRHSSWARRGLWLLTKYQSV